MIWKGDDPDIPRRTVGVVKSFHDDGDIEVLFPSPGGGSQMFSFVENRLAHAFGKGDEVNNYVFSESDLYVFKLI